MYVDIKPEYTKENPYFSFSQYVKEKYKARVGKISIDTNFGCEHNRKNGGCIFCNLDGYRPNNTNENGAESQWQKGLASRRYEKFYAYFQLGTPLSSESRKETLSVFEKVIVKENCVGAMFGARSDMTSDYVLETLNETAWKIKKEIWLEMGLQSANNKTLAYINRGHDYENFENMVYKIERRYKNIYVCAHAVIGLPKNEYEIENEDDVMRTVKTLSSLPIASVKYHNLEIVKNTEIEKMNAEKNMQTFSEDEYIKMMASVIGYTNERFVISRIVGDTKKEYLIAPSWKKNKTEILSGINNILAERNIRQGSYLSDLGKNNKET